MVIDAEPINCNQARTEWGELLVNERVFGSEWKRRQVDVGSALLYRLLG